MSILCQKNVHSPKNMVLSYHLCKTFHKNPYCHAHIWSKNVNSMKATLFYGLKKSKGCPFSRIFKKISLLSCPYFIKNTPILKKNTVLSRPYFVKKNVHSLKKLYSHVILSQIFMKNSLPSCTYLVKKRIFCRNCSMFGSDKSIGYPFPIFHGKITVLIPIFCQKTSIL